MVGLFWDVISSILYSWWLLACEYWMWVPVVVLMLSIRPVGLKIHTFLIGGSRR